MSSYRNTRQYQKGVILRRKFERNQIKNLLKILLSVKGRSG